MPDPTAQPRDFPNTNLAPPVLFQRRSQLSLRALFFLQMQAAVIMLLITFAMTRQNATVPFLVGTFIAITLFTCLVAMLLSQHFAMRWWWAIGPATGVATGLLASCLIVSPPENFQRLMVTAFACSTILVVLCVWQGRYLPQVESPDD